MPDRDKIIDQFFGGAITHRSLHEEPYKGHWGRPEIYTRDKEAAPQPKGTIRGLAAVVSREFGIPAVVGTGVASQKIQTGQRVRVNGMVEVVA